MPLNARLQRVRKNVESPQTLSFREPAFGARNLLFFGIPVEKQIPPPPRSEFGMTVAEASGLFGNREDMPQNSSKPRSPEPRNPKSRNFVPAIANDSDEISARRDLDY